MRGSRRREVRGLSLAEALLRLKRLSNGWVFGGGLDGLRVTEARKEPGVGMNTPPLGFSVEDMLSSDDTENGRFTTAD